MNTNCTQPDESKNIKKKLPNKKSQRQKRKRLNKQGRKEIKRNAKLSFTMSTWAESFSLASNWQTKHQLAYWKARAKALEYENSILHDIIRKNYLGSNSERDTNVEQIDDNETEETNQVNHDHNNLECDGLNSDNDVDNDDFEVSEEFIEFLRSNAKYKEDARIERERLKMKQLAEEKEEQESKDCVLMNQDQLKELYGDKWQRISVLQMSLMTEYMNKSDESNPVFWPNIPFNFNYS